MREGIRYDWIIAVSNSAESGIKILKTYCKVSEIKQILVDLAKRDARKDAAAFKHGTDDIDQLQVVKHDAPFDVDIGFTAYNVLIHTVLITPHTSLNTRTTVNLKTY